MRSCWPAHPVASGARFPSTFQSEAEEVFPSCRGKSYGQRGIGRELFDGLVQPVGKTFLRPRSRPGSARDGVDGPRCAGTPGASEPANAAFIIGYAQRSWIRFCRSTQRQRTTPSRSGSGPASIRAVSSASCTALSFDRPPTGKVRPAQIFVAVIGASA